VSALSARSAPSENGHRPTKGKKAYAEHSERYLDALDRLAPYRAALLELGPTRTRGFNRVMALQDCKGFTRSRTGIQEALIRATEIPSHTASCAADALRVLEELRSIIHASRIDMQVALTMLRSAIRGAGSQHAHQPHGHQESGHPHALRGHDRRVEQLIRRATTPDDADCSLGEC